MKASVVLALSFSAIFLMESFAAAEVTQPTERREWNFDLSKGATFTISLIGIRSVRDGQQLYVLRLTCKGTCPEVAEEARYVRSVAEQMEQQGLPPRRISGIHLELSEPDLSRQLSLAAYRSNDWRQSKRTSHGLVIVKLLQSIKAYREFDEALSPYGLQVEVVHAEHISTVSPKALGLNPSAVSAVPSGASLELVVRQR